MPRLLITSMGGAGSLNLVDTIGLAPDASSFETIGTHFNPYELAKSNLEKLFVVPRASDEEAYIEAHLRLIEAHGVDLLIANSDVEAAVFSRHRDKLPCAHLLPNPKQVEVVQDKLHFHRTLEAQGCRTVPNIPVVSRKTVGDAIDQLGLKDGERFWIRLREGAGSQGATWLYTAEQAQKWMDLWCELRGMKVTDFVLAPFLGGRDFCCSVLFRNGEMCVAKVYERLAYYTADVSLSMMGSTPQTSQTLDEREPIHATIEAVEAVCRAFDETPHGLYQADLKCNEAGTPFVTEINIGRFPMTSPQFDRVGKHCQLMLYIQLALTPDAPLPSGEFDLDPGWVFLRGVDTPLIIRPADRISELKSQTA